MFPGQSWSVILGVLRDSSKNEDCHFRGFSGANTGRLTCDLSPISSLALRSICVSLFVNLLKNVLFFCVYFKGANSYGQLGLGHKEDVLVPQSLKDVSCKCQDIKSITGGGGHSAVITGKNMALARSVGLRHTFFFPVSLLVWCCHLSVASASEQVPVLSCKTGFSHADSLSILEKLRFCLSSVVTLWLCEDCFLTCFVLQLLIQSSQFFCIEDGSWEGGVEWEVIQS